MSIFAYMGTAIFHLLGEMEGVSGSQLGVEG